MHPACQVSSQQPMGNAGSVGIPGPNSRPTRQPVLLGDRRGCDRLSSSGWFPCCAVAGSSASATTTTGCYAAATA